MKIILSASIGVILLSQTAISQETTLVVTKKSKVSQNSGAFLSQSPQVITVNKADAQTTIATMMATGLYEAVEEDIEVNPPGFIVEEDTIFYKLHDASDDPNVFTPNDPLFNWQQYWGDKSYSTPVHLGISRAIARANTTERVRVAFLDGGYLEEGTSEDMVPIDNISMVVADNAERQGVFYNSAVGDSAYSSPEEIACEIGHGIGVSGIATASTNNNNQIAGIAGNGYVDTILIQSILCGTGRLRDTSNGIRWAAGGQVDNVRLIDERVDIISISLGGVSSCPVHLQNAIDFANSQGVIVVAAAGNDNIPVEQFTPANCDGVITVGGSSDASLDLVSYSNYGPKIDIVARADTLLSLGKLDGQSDSQTYGTQHWSGTSFAAPQITAMLAMAKSSAPTITPDTLLSLMQLTSTPLSGPKCENVGCDNGLVNAERFINAVMGIEEGNTGTISTALKEGQLCDTELYTMIDAVKAKLCESVTVSLTNLVAQEHENVSVKFLSAPLNAPINTNTATVEYEGSEFTFDATGLDLENRQFAYQICISGECHDTIFPVDIDSQSIALCQ